MSGALDYSSEHVRAAADGIVAELMERDRWPDPMPLGGEPDLPPFPVDALPEWQADKVSALAEFTQTDPGMAGAYALAVTAAAAGGRAEVEVRRGWREPVNLFVAVTAAPGERKSPVAAALTAPLMEAEDKLTGAAQGNIVEAETTRDIARRDADERKRKAGRADGDQRDRLLAEAIAAAQHAEAIDVPATPRLVSDDATPEAAAALLAEQRGRLALLSAEGGIFDIAAGRYSNNVPNLDVFLKGHAGDMLRVDRKGHAPLYVRRPALTVGLMLQPSVLTRIAGNESFRGRGLLARFLYALPPSKVGARKVGADPVAPEVDQAYAGQLQALVATLTDWEDPAVLTLTPEADRVLLDHERCTEPRLDPAGDLGPLADWGAKLAGATARIAGLLHLADHPETGWRQAINADAMHRAVRIADYFTDHAVAAFTRMRADPRAEDARYLMNVLTNHAANIAHAGHEGRVTIRDMFTWVSRARFRTVTDLHPAVDMLTDHGHLARLPDPERSGQGRAPSPAYAVHPHIWKPQKPR